MDISERSVEDAVARVQPAATDVGWFAARQPGVVRFLEERLLTSDGDAFAVALEASWRICALFHERNGLPPPRVTRSLLERAESAVLSEARADSHHADGCAQRQPAICSWLEGYIGDPPVPLTAAESRRTGTALAAVIYALDELTTGRAVP